MRRTIIAALLSGSVALGAANLIVYNDRQNDRIEEDDPRWDCRTMGNKICGPGSDLAYLTGYELGQRLKADLDAGIVHDNLIEQCEGVSDDPFCDAIHKYQDRRIAK